MQTIRHQIIRLLRTKEMTALDLSRELRLPEKEVYTHLPHISSTLRTTGRKLTVLPSKCLSCGYVFRDRTRFTPPGRCPVCKKSRIRRPAYHIP